MTLRKVCPLSEPQHAHPYNGDNNRTNHKFERKVPGVSVVKSPPANVGDSGDTGSIPGSGRSPGEGNGNPLQYPCLRNPMDRGAQWAPIHQVTRARHPLVAEQEQQSMQKAQPSAWHIVSALQILATTGLLFYIGV